MIGAAAAADRSLRWLGLATLAAVMAAGALGWHAGAPDAGPALAEASPAWTLPAPRVEDVDGDLRVLRQRRPWDETGAGAGAQADAAAPAGWRLAGIVERGGARLALIAVGSDAEAQKLLYLSVGDRLPDGSAVARIDADGIAVADDPAHDAGLRDYRLYAKH